MGRHRRRRFLRGAAIAGSVGVVGCLGGGDEYGEDWVDVDRVQLAATSTSWIGEAPDPIVDANNPALRLIYGRTYEIEWRNADGREHRLEIWNGEDQHIAGDVTLAEEGETATLEVQAVGGMTTYVCPHHEVTMVGSIEIFTSDQTR